MRAVGADSGGTQKKRRKERPTIDGGQFDRPLPKQRRRIFIADKMKVLSFYKKLLTDEKEAKDVVAAPKRKLASAQERKDLKQAKKIAKEKLRRNKQFLCQKAFPEIVGKSYVWKWWKTAKREAWDQLPEQVQWRLVATPNTWRAKLGLPRKGREEFRRSKIPEPIQIELDFLVLEHARGRSDVSERREVVTTDHVAAWLNHAEPLTWTCQCLMLGKNS